MTITKIISMKDVALRGSQPTVREWIRVRSIQLMLERTFTPIAWNGQMRGDAVSAFINNSRWLALCPEPNCGGCEYVDPREPIFFCMKCGNGGNGFALPVRFPKDWKEIELALLEREMIVPAIPPRKGAGLIGKKGEDLVNMAFNARPAHPNLRRDWAPRELENAPGMQGHAIMHKFGMKAGDLRAETARIKEGR